MFDTLPKGIYKAYTKILSLVTPIPIFSLLYCNKKNIFTKNLLIYFILITL